MIDTESLGFVPVPGPKALQTFTYIYIYIYTLAQIRLPHCKINCLALRRLVIILG